MKNTNFRFWVQNAFKGIAATVLCNFFGYLFYTFLLNARNTEYPESASAGTVIFSLIVFASLIILTYLFAMLGANDSSKLDEASMLENAYRDSNYTLDYKTYFKDQLKKRLWSYYLVAALAQIPLITNYYIAQLAKYETVFHCPLTFFKFFTSSIFAYELLGRLWYLGPLLYLVLFAAVFTFLVYRGEKKWMVKPSYVK